MGALIHPMFSGEGAHPGRSAQERDPRSGRVGEEGERVQVMLLDNVGGAADRLTRRLEMFLEGKDGDTGWNLETVTKRTTCEKCRPGIAASSLSRACGHPGKESCKGRGSSRT